MPKPAPITTLADDLIPTSVVAQIHDVNVATVNRWAKSGRLAVAVKIPGKRGANLYRRADVERLDAAS